MNLLVPVILGWMAVCRTESTEDGEESGKTIVTEYVNGNLEERLTVDHSSYHTPTTGPDKDQRLYSKFNTEPPHSQAAFAGLPLLRYKQPPKKLIIPVNEPPEESKKHDDGVTHYSGGYRAPAPTLPQDFLNEINEMKIPKHDLPISVQDYKFYAQNSLPQTLEDNMENDIEEPDFRKYFHKDYHVPTEYNRFKFNFKGYHQDKVDGDGDDNDDDDEEEDGREESADDDPPEHNHSGSLTAFKENEESITITPPFRVVTETRFKYEDHKNKPIKFPYDFEGNTGLHSQMDHDKQCFVNCLSNGGLKSAPYGIHHYNSYSPSFVSPPPRLIRTTLPVYHRHRDPVIVAPHYHYRRRVPVQYRPVLYSYPIRRPYPYVRFYRRLPYPYRSYGHPKYFPLGKPVISPGFPNIRHPKTDAEQTKPDRDCPPSKIVKEVHVHHYPKGEVDDPKTPLIELDEANHEENFDHESINEDEDESSGDEDELTDGEHEELIELRQHLDNALYHNKKKLVRHLKDGQRYPIYDVDHFNE